MESGEVKRHAKHPAHANHADAASPTQRLYAFRERSPERVRGLAEYLLRRSSDVPNLTIGTVAAEAGVSKSTVVRLCSALGYSGYREFRMAMAENRGMLRGVEVLGSDIPVDVEPGGSLATLAQRVVHINAEVLLDTLRQLDVEVLQEVTACCLRADHVLFFGVGSSAPIVMDASQRFLRLGIRSTFHLDPHVLANALMYSSERDVLFAISYSGASREVVEALQLAEQQALTTVVLTSIPDSIATRHASLTLISSVRRAPVPAETVASRVSQLAIIDVLCAAIGLELDPEAIAKAARAERELQRRRAPSGA